MHHKFRRERLLEEVARVRSVLVHEYADVVVHATDGILQSASPRHVGLAFGQDRPAKVTRSLLSGIDANHQASVTVPGLFTRIEE